MKKIYTIRITMSEERRTRRKLLRLSKKGKLNEQFLDKSYMDNKGNAYPYKWMASTSSFINIFLGCLKNGFPVVVPKLRYPAWAFYPFFFVQKDLKVKDPISVLNHERIHVRQQRDIHITISLPVILLCFLAELFGSSNFIYLLCIVPFIPTVVYGIEMIRSLRHLLLMSDDSKITFSRVRENTCFEREAICHSPNADYLFKRKFWAVLAYTGIKAFKNYGMKND